MHIHFIYESEYFVYVPERCAGNTGYIRKQFISDRFKAVYIAVLCQISIIL